MEQRRTHIAKAGDQRRVQPVEGIERYAAVAIPILAAARRHRCGLPDHAGKRRRPRGRRRQADPGGRRLPGPPDGGIIPPQKRPEASEIKRFRPLLCLI